MLYLILLSLWFINFNFDFVRSQVLADSKSQNINFYKEMLYPAFRRHRSRIRPYARLLGAPINHIRGTRDTNNIYDLSDAECIYTMNSLTCSGYNSKNFEINFQCDADLNIKQLGTKVLIGNLMISKKNYSTIKLNIFELDQLESKNSINFVLDHLNENGIQIQDKDCWTKMINFFIDVTVRKILNYIEPFNYIASILFI